LKHVVYNILNNGINRVVIDVIFIYLFVVHLLQEMYKPGV